MRSQDRTIIYLGGQTGLNGIVVAWHIDKHMDRVAYELWAFAITELLVFVGGGAVADKHTCRQTGRVTDERTDRRM